MQPTPLQYSNLPLSWHDLPRHENLQLQPVAPSFLNVLYLQRGLWTLLLLALATGVFFWEPQLQQPLFYAGMALGIAVQLGVGLFLSRKRFQNMGFALRTHDLVYRNGWLFEKLHVVPLVKVQHCQVKKGPLERRYGLSTLRVYTAGVSGADLVLEGLTDSQALQLKDWLLQKHHLPQPHEKPATDAATELE
ncbi:MAG: PH domain-containing protein [Lacibacter sp.]